ARRVAPFGPDVLLEPAKPCGDDLNLGGERIFRSQSVTKQRAAVPEALQLLADRRDRLATPGMPAAAVGEDDGRKPWLWREVQIDHLLIAAPSVRDVLFDGGLLVRGLGLLALTARNEQEHSEKSGGG